MVVAELPVMTLGTTALKEALHCLNLTPSDVTRFQAGLTVLGADDCWLWGGALTGGHGVLRLSKRNKNIYIHRLAYLLRFGAIPEGLDVCHTCEPRYPAGDITSRRCGNWAHLVLDTQEGNTRFAAAHGRMNRGERHGGVVLCERQVLEIRERNQGGVPQAELARIYHVTRSTINDIVKGRSWTYL